MKNFLKVLVILILVAEVALLGLRLVNTCDDCEKNFFGVGYVGNAIDNAVNEEEQILCEECAELHHKVELVVGKTLDDFKRELVPAKWVPGDWSSDSDGE